MTVLVVAEAVVIVLLAILVVGMLRSHAEILRKLHELGAGESDAEPPFSTADGVAAPRPPGAVAHDISGETPAGGVTGIRLAARGGSTLLAFMSTTCATCEHFWPQFGAREAVEALGSVRLVIVTKSSDDELPAEVARLAPPGISLVMSSQAWEDYQVPGSPYFFMIDGATGQISGEGSAGSWDKLLDLMGIADGDVAVAPTGLDDTDRAQRIEQELADAGILPGDPQLYGEHGLQQDSAT